MRVLIADGDARVWQEARLALVANGDQVQTALDGQECLARLVDFLPDVLVLDGNLAEGGCDDVLASMANNPAISHTPVVVMIPSSSSHFDGARYHNVVAWIQKPLQSAKLLEKIGAAVKSSPPAIPPT